MREPGTARAICNWGILLLATAACVAVSVRYLDMPIAALFAGMEHHVHRLGKLFSARMVITVQGLAALGLAIFRLLKGRWTDTTRLFFWATCVSICALVGNDYILKVVFGRSTPDVSSLSDMDFGFHLFRGSRYSGFPSGHMATGAAFVTMFARLGSPAWPYLAAGLAVLGCLLMVGEWHFLSDLMAGAFWGVTLGMIGAALAVRSDGKRF